MLLRDHNRLLTVTAGLDIIALLRGTWLSDFNLRLDPFTRFLMSHRSGRQHMPRFQFSSATFQPRQFFVFPSYFSLATTAES